MTTRVRKARVETEELTSDGLIAWLREKIGDTKHEAFAAQLGVTRQVLSGVLTGRRAPGAIFLSTLKQHGYLGVRRVYIVAKPKGKPCTQPSTSSQQS